MLHLKEYQQRALSALQAYFTECDRIGDADTAFYGITRNIFGTGIPYRSVPELPGLPYVCLRIPTGGGKTLVACHAVGIAARYLLAADRSVILWLVPSNAIREQTLNALRDRKHPYRQAVESAVGTVTVLDIGEALYVQRSTLDTETTVIISTVQAFRVEDTEGRKVYESSGALMSHFSGVPEETLADLERREDGSVAYSLANVLRIRRPTMIVDEAHNARTDLSFETLARFRPSCIIEFTATPDAKDHPSNVLYSASAAELRAEEMIKLPIMLETRAYWKELIADAVALRSNLENDARFERQESGEYLRPIMLIQAQPNRKGQDCITVDIVERCLVEDNQIPKEQIARATGTERGLEGIDLPDPDCKIRYVITIQALREGWDCPFAYVLCSVAQLSSATAVEQILGRVMRLPGAKRKARDELNRAYAFVASQSFAEAARALADALVEYHGFNRQDARDLIVQPTVVQGELPLQQEADDSTVSVVVPETLRMDQLPPEMASKITYDPDARVLTFKGIMETRERDYLVQCFSTDEGKASVGSLYQRANGSAGASRTPSERGVVFSIPQLAIKQGDLFEVLEQTHFLGRPWQLSQCDASLTEAEFPSERSEGQQGEITVGDTGRLEVHFLSRLHREVALLDRQSGWTVAELANWLDRTIPHLDITPTESGIFLAKLVRTLVDERGLDFGQLVNDRYRLRGAATAKIDQYRKDAHTSSYQALLLLGSATPLVVTPGVCFSFPQSDYPYSTRYDGAYKFKKHYYPQVGDLKPAGEELECAQFLDSLPQVKYWVRNLERRPSHSFWLQTSTDKFYPDFACLLNDGRYLVVEYKGEDRWSNEDSTEKRDIGGLWEARSSGKCLFVMPKGKDLNSVRAQIG